MDQIAHAQVIALRALVQDVLLPAHNDFDADESERLQREMHDEEVRDNLPQKDAVGGARTPTVALGMARKAEQHRRVLRALLRAFDMDCGLLDSLPAAGDKNWLEIVSERLCTVVPAAAWRLYCEVEPTELEGATLLALVGARGGQPAEAPQPRVWQRHRDRGMLPMTASFLARLVVRPLNHVASFAIPNDAALEAIASVAPLIECGAGTGYWSALLQSRGVDCLAYDSQPPTPSFNNGFFDATYTEVKQGDGGELFAARAELAQRTLLLVWPNNPDPVDNPHLLRPGESQLQPLWDARSLGAFIAAGGATVVYVGERESELRLTAGSPPESGSSSSRAFQQLLAAHFELVRTVKTPTWPFNADDCTIWERRGGRGRHAPAAGFVVPAPVDCT